MQNQQKQVSVNVKLGLDSLKFSQQVESLAKNFKPIEISISQKNLPKLKVEADELQIKKLFGEGFGTTLGEQISKSLKSVKIDQGSGFFSSILSPLKSISTGAFEGIGKEISSNIGKGVARGIESQAAPLIGSFDLLGEKLVTKAAPRLKNLLPERVTKISQSLIEEIIGKDTLSKASNDVKSFFRNTVGDADAIIAREVRASVAAKNRDRGLAIAAKSLAAQLQEDLAGQAEKQASASKISARDRRLATEEQKARIQYKEASTKLVEYEAKLDSELARRIKTLTDSGEEVSDVRKFQLREEIRNAASVQKELIQLQKQEAVTSATLNQILVQRRTLQTLIAQLTNPISEKTKELEKIGVKSPALDVIQNLRKQSEVANKLVEDFRAQKRLEFAKQDVSINRLSNLISGNKNQLSDKFSEYKEKSSQASPEERKALLQQVRKERSLLFRQINAAEIGIQKRTAQIAINSEKVGQELSGLIATNVTFQNQVLGAYVVAQQKLAQELSAKTKKVAQQNTQQVEQVKAVAPKQTESQKPVVYKKIAEQVLGISGKTGASIPDISHRDDIDNGAAIYNQLQNKIFLSKENYGKLAAGNVDKLLVEKIVHELRHSLQFEGGKNQQGTGVDKLTPNAEEFDRLGKRIALSVLYAKKKAPDITAQEIAIVRETEADAYVFADRYTQQILDVIQGIASPKNIANVKPKLTEKQRLLNQLRAKTEEKLFASLTEQNKANLEQLTKVQLTSIAKSSGVKGYSNKKVDELRNYLLQKINPEQLSFLIPTFSKIDPEQFKYAKDFASLPVQQIRQQAKELSDYFRKNTAIAGRAGDTESLKNVLGEISNLRKIYASALAQDISQESRQFLSSAIASLGKQKIAAEQRIQNINFTKSRSQQQQTTGQPSRVIEQYGFSEIFDPIEKELGQLRRRIIQRQNVLSGKSPANTKEIDNLINRLSKAASGAEAKITGYVEQINRQVSQKVISANEAMARLQKLTQAAENEQRRRSNATVKSFEASFKQSEKALRQLENQTTRQVSEIDASRRYSAQQQAREQKARLQRYGIDQTEPVQMQEPKPTQAPFNPKQFVNRVKAEISDFRAQSVKKQSTVLGNQATAILVDLDSQTAIGKAAVIEAKTINKQITENEKRIQKILSTVKASKEGKMPQLTAGDLQRLSGRLQQLDSMVNADRQRIAQLEPVIKNARQLQPVRQSLQSTNEKVGSIASQKQLSNEDVQRLNKYNNQLRESLKLLGVAPPKPPGGFFDLNAKMPGLIKNVFNLVKGFLAFQALNFVQSQLQQVAVEAFQTSMRFEALEKSLQFVSGSTQDGAANLAFVRKEVERLSLPLEASIKGFTGLTAAAKGTSLEGAQTQKIFTAIAQASRVFGLTSEETQGALLAVQQMISKGTVSAEELRGQLGERLPGAFQIFARGMGITTQELSKQLELGKVGLDDLTKFAAQLEKETAEGVAGATKTSSASLQRLQNQITSFNRSVGDAISPAAIAAFDILGNSLEFVQKNAKLVRAAVIGMTGALTLIMLPSIIAVGSALMTFAATTIPLATAAMIAFVAANPVAIAGLAALTAGLIVAEDAAKALANALNGVSQAQLDQSDKDTSFDNKLLQGQLQLIKQVPLTKDKLDELTAGLEDQAKRGLRTAKSSQTLTEQLKRMQAQAEATAKAQNDLKKAVTDSETAFKNNKIKVDQAKTQGELAFNKARANGSLSEEGSKDWEFQIEQTHNKNLLNSYDTRIKQIKAFLKQSEDLKKAGRNGLDAKQEKDLQEELLTNQKEYSQAQINLLKSEISQKKDVRERRIKDFEEAEQIQEGYRKAGIVNEQKAIDSLEQIRQSKAKEELRQIVEKRKKLNKTDKEGLEALAVQEATVLAKMAENRKSRFDEQLAFVKGNADRITAYWEARQKQGLTTEQQAAIQAIAVASQSQRAQLMLIRQRLAETPKTDTATRDELLVQEQQALAAVAEARKNAYSKSIEEVKSKEELELAVVAYARSHSVLSEAQFNKQQYDQKVKALDEQLSLIQQRRGELNAADIDGMRELDKAEADVYRQRVEAQKAFLDSQLQQLEKNQQAAKDIVTSSIKEREIEVQKLLNERVLNQEEAQVYLNQITKDGIAEELRAEEEKIAKLQSLKYTDPTAEEDRQIKIRQSRIRTSELTLQLLQNEKQQQEALFAAISKAYDRVNQIIANGATRFTQPLERQLQLSNALEKSFDIQNKLLDARKGLYSALQSYVNADLQILQDTADTEEEKKQLAEAAASAKLQAARIQVEIDRQSLELQIKQTEAAQRRLEVENAIAQIKNRADIAQKQAELAKVKADPNATQEQIDAAQLLLEASQLEGVGLKEQAQMLNQERLANNQINDARRRTQQLEGGANVRKAEYDAANAIADEGDRKKALDRLKQQSAIKLFGTENYQGNLEDYNNANRGYAQTPLQNYFASQVRNALVPVLPEIILPQVEANNAFSSYVDSFGTAVNTLMNFVSSKLATPTQVTITAPITNNIDSRNAGNIDVAGQFRKQLYDLGLELNRKT